MSIDLREGLWISNGCDQSRGEHRADARSFIEPHAQLVGSVPGPDQLVELQDPLLDHPQLRPKSGQTCAELRNRCHWIGDDIEQFLDTVTPNRRNDPELGKMGPDRIDHRGLLTDEQMARTVKQQAALLLRGLGWYEPMLALVTASQIASASVTSFFCRLT